MDKLKIKGAIVSRYGSQTVFARQIGLSECRLSRLLNGFQEPKPAERARLVTALGADYFREDDQPRPGA